ncbi:MAG TPA: hypothetical protein VFY05_13895 [Candidatus Angelobacter sp.]|nr:hypothetical protein [Candidatus Angelobacter sp.]
MPWFLPGLIDVAGKSPLQRTAERLKKFGISQTAGVIEAPPYEGTSKSAITGSQVLVPPDRFWRAAENAFNDLVQAGAELVVLVRLGAYAEIDYDNMIQAHLDGHCRVSQATQNGSRLDIFCISASRRNDAASLFRSRLTRCRSDCPLFEHSGYVNALADALDLRQFAIDILTLQTDTAPAGEQVRPGVWTARRAQIEKGARVLAPAFIGSFARVRSGAVITRCSAVEHHANVDCGTVVENSTVLPYCSLGAALEVAHSVAGYSHIWNLRRSCAVRISDAKLLRSVAGSGNRVMVSAAKLITYLPRQFWRGVFGQPVSPRPDLNAALRQTSPTLGSASGYRAPACDTQAANEFPSNLVVARTHGNQ